jgi:predicted Zn-dependent peptidase
VGLAYFLQNPPLPQVDFMQMMISVLVIFRFEAHMEVHVGSIDEEEDEQGIAHMIEHVAFLGSKKREKLLGTGARSNAYTDFHHTVFHIHSPTSTKVFLDFIPH